MTEFTNYTWVLIKMLGVLLFVCTLAIVSLRALLPRLGGGRKGSRKLVNIVDRYPIEPKKSLYLVKVGEGHHLLGVTEQGINYLMAVDERVVAHFQEDLQVEPALGMHRSFQDILQGLKGKSSVNSGEKP